MVTGVLEDSPVMQNEANLLPADRQWARGGKVALPAPPGPSV
jgi:hypothetical protein